MNVLFLDVDGVLNDFATLLFTDGELSDEKLEMVASLCKEFDCKIVLSTSWRGGMNEDTLECRQGSAAEIISKALKSKGCEIVGRTRELNNGRGADIAEYISRKLTSADNFLILDDEDVTICPWNDIRHEELADHFLRTKASNGMTYEDYRKVQAFFAGDRDWKTKTFTVEE